MKKKELSLVRSVIDKPTAKIENSQPLCLECNGGNNLKFKVEIWKISDLLESYEAGQIELDPPYQRNEVWTLKSQKLLIESIKNNWPIPTFFFLKREDGKYEMVDGQQRSRSIIGYWRGHFPDTNKIKFDDSFKGDKTNKDALDQFNKYELNITIISELIEDEHIEEFYDRVNSTGLRLSKGETIKAAHVRTNLLNLIQNLANNPLFTDLKLFSAATLKRMNDIDFISELVALLEFGITEKKKAADDLLRTDILEEKYSELEEKFIEIHQHISRFNSITPIRTTRYRQKNDFYTLFGFLKSNLSIDHGTLDYFYKTLVVLGPYITPSQENCDPLLEYAVNCVTQSNSENARLKRNEFFETIFLNTSEQPNETQLSILRFFQSDDDCVTSLSGFTLIDIDRLNNPLE